MTDPFFDAPILNSPYEYPTRHWELDKDRQPTNRIVDWRRPAAYITPVPQPRRQRGQSQQQALVLDEGKGLSTEEQEYDPTSTINVLRRHVDEWRALPDRSDWGVTPETAPPLAALAAPRLQRHPAVLLPGRGGRDSHLADRSRARAAQPRGTRDPRATRRRQRAGEPRACATGAQASDRRRQDDGHGDAHRLADDQRCEAADQPQFHARVSRGHPRPDHPDRLRVLMPNDPDSYYQSRELVPRDMLAELEQAKIVITNYHAFKQRETLDLSKGGRSLLQGRGPKIQSIETEGQMLQRVMPELMGMRSIMAFNDEAHHCYREKPPDEDEEGRLTGDDRKEAEKNLEAARLWINGLHAVDRKLGLRRIIDLSATPFFLRGSGVRGGDAIPVDDERLLADGRH